MNWKSFSFLSHSSYSTVDPLLFRMVSFFRLFRRANLKYSNKNAWQATGWHLESSQCRSTIYFPWWWLAESPKQKTVDASLYLVPRQFLTFVLMQIKIYFYNIKILAVPKRLWPPTPVSTGTSFLPNEAQLFHFVQLKNQNTKQAKHIHRTAECQSHDSSLSLISYPYPSYPYVQGYDEKLCCSMYFIHRHTLEGATIRMIIYTKHNHHHNFLF